jgi:Mitochondrial carrier protein
MELYKLGFKQKSKQHVKPKAELLAGALAGAISSLAVAPIDRTADVRSLGRFLGQDIPTSIRTSTPKLLKEMYRIGKKEKIGPLGGIRGFYEGAGIKALKLAPATAISFLTYEALKKQFNKKIH